MKVALIGNPNSGKSTLFNILTGLNQRVGNFTGVTIARKEGRLKGSPSVTVIDLPGVYSLNAYSPEERISTTYLASERPDLVVDVIDSTDLKKALPLVKELLATGLNVLLALNMSDELKSAGITIDPSALSLALGAPAVMISAKRKTGIKALISAITEAQSQTYRTLKTSSLTIDEIYDKCCKASKTKRSITEKIDSVVLNRYLAIPVFILIMLGVFYLSIEATGALNEYCSEALTVTLPTKAYESLIGFGVGNVLSELLSYGVLKGVGTVLGFLPSLIVLYVLTAILEDSGYMSRAAVIADGLLKKIGLSGRAFVPLITGCGCTVPALTASRIVEDEDERILTMTLAPFVPCSAKLPVFSLVVGSVTGGGALGVLFVYVMSVVAVVLTGLLVKVWKSTDDEKVFVLELPKYRLPSLESLIKDVFIKVKDFLLRAGSVILLTSVAVWFLSSYDFGLNRVDATESILYVAGDFISPMLIPIGITRPEFSIAFLTGIFAKENVAATLGLLAEGNIESYLSGMISLPSAYAYVTLVLLFPPCASALSVMRKELGSFSTFIKVVVLETTVAYALSMSVYAVFMLFTLYRTLAVTIFLSLGFAAVCLMAIRYIRKRPCAACADNCVLKKRRRCDKIS